MISSTAPPTAKCHNLSPLRSFSIDGPSTLLCASPAKDASQHCGGAQYEFAVTVPHPITSLAEGCGSVALNQTPPNTRVLILCLNLTFGLFGRARRRLSPLSRRASPTSRSAACTQRGCCSRRLSPS